MAKYYITMSCGHDEEVTLYGKIKDREGKIKWFEENGLCKECYKAKMQEQNEKVWKAIEGEINLPELEGSEKQIAWATEIRKRSFVKVARAAINEKTKKQAFERLAGQKKAAYWIDRRDWDGDNLIYSE